LTRGEKYLPNMTLLGKRHANRHLVASYSNSSICSGVYPEASNKSNLLIQFLGLKGKWVFLELDTPFMGM
jgi:hypothetical protein